MHILNIKENHSHFRQLRHLKTIGGQDTHRPHRSPEKVKVISLNGYYSSQDFKQISISLHQTLSPWWGAKNIQVLNNWKAMICQEARILIKACIMPVKFKRIIFFLCIKLSLPILWPNLPPPGDHSSESTLSILSTQVTAFLANCFLKKKNSNIFAIYS